MVACAAFCGGALDTLGMGMACELPCVADCGGALETLGMDIACCLAGAAGETGWVVEPGCSAMQRKPHFGQNLDLLGRGSRQCGHSTAPQFLQIG